MRFFIVTLAVLGLGMLFLALGIAQQGSSLPALLTLRGDPPELTARAWGVYDAATGELLFGSNVDQVYPIASLTKLMTATVATEEIPLMATTTLSWRAVSTEGRAGRLRAGEKMTVHGLLFPLMIESSNDAAEALAEYAGRDSFIATMNSHAAALGMAATHYTDPTGLGDGNVASVADIAVLLGYIAREHRHILDITELPQYLSPTHEWHNVNPVAALTSFRGGKHGYTDAANRTLAALFAERIAPGDTRQFIVVVLGSENLVADTELIRAHLRANVIYR